MIAPDLEAIKKHLGELFEVAQVEYPDGLVELRHGPPDNLTGHALFFITDHGLQLAAEHAARRNSQGENVYVGVNPRKPGTSRQATANDVEIAFYHFADIDKAEPVERLGERLAPLLPTMSVTTGMFPNRRPHLYWRLEEPVRNMAEWTARQAGIADALEGDRVIDPPRIMRLGGTVNFPTQKKLQAGYKVELTGVRTQFTVERSDVTPDMIRLAFPAREVPAISQVPMQVQSGATTLSLGRTKLADLMAACHAGDEWHNNMTRLVAHMAAIGRTDTEILGLAAGLTLPGYTVQDTWREMATALRGARVKWNLPEPDDAEVPLSAVTADGLLPFEWFDDIEAQLDANWLVDDFIPQGGLTLVYGHPGCGKSFFALDVAMHIAMAQEWRDRPVQQGLIIYVGAEGQRGLRQRIAAFRQHHRIDELPFLLVPVEVDLLSSKEDVAALVATIEHCAARFSLPIAMIVIDTLSRTFGGGDEVGTDMAAYINNVGRVQSRFNCAAMVIHHRPKDSTNETPRGHGSLWGACDTILLVEDLGGTKQVRNTKQKDGEASQPILFKLHVVELGEDEKSRPVTSCVVVPSDNQALAAPAGRKLSAGQKITLEQLGQTMEVEGFSVPDSIPQNALNRVRIGKVCSLEKWQARAVSALSGPDMTPDSAQRAFRRNRNRLQELDIIGVFDDYAWIVH